MYLSLIEDSLNFSSSIQKKTYTTSNNILIIQHSRGVIECIPSSHSDNAIILSSGIHGNETAPIEILDSLLRDIQLGSVNLAHPCLFIFAHPEATHSFLRYFDTNLNRLFSHYPIENQDIKEVHIANQLMKHVDDFYGKHNKKHQWHMDLHCSIRDSNHYTFAVHPFNSHYQRSTPLLHLLARCHIEACLFSEAPSSTFSWYTAEYYGAHSATVELGKVATLGENNMNALEGFIKGINAFLTDVTPKTCNSHVDVANVDVNDANAQCEEIQIEQYQVSRTLVKNSEQFTFCFPDDLANFTPFQKGQRLATEGSTQYRIQEDVEYIVFPNQNVEIGHRACLLARKISNH